MRRNYFSSFIRNQYAGVYTDIRSKSFYQKWCKSYMNKWEKRKIIDNLNEIKKLERELYLLGRRENHNGATDRTIMPKRNLTNVKISLHKQVISFLQKRK